MKYLNRITSSWFIHTDTHPIAGFLASNADLGESTLISNIFLYLAQLSVLE